MHLYITISISMMATIANDPSGICFDIGCNKGMWTDANRQKFKTFVLVDANPKLIESCKEKYPDNPDIHPVNALISDKPDVPFYVCDQIDTISSADKEWISGSRFSSEYTWSTEIKIQTMSLDSLIKQFGNPDLIKIDVEGYELSACKSLTQKVDMLCFEWAEEKYKEILETLEHLHNIGFNMYSIQYEDDYNHVPDNFASYEMLVNLLSMNLKEDRKSLWGMIWCK